MQDLGELTGDVVLYGGPYSNLQALLAFRSAADALAIPEHRRICTGDIVAYGADPLACADLLAGSVVVAGNCERQIASGAEDCGCGFDAGSSCDLASRGWFPRAATALRDTAHPARFAALPDIAVFRHAGKRYGVIHGGLSDIARFIWPTSPETVFAEERALLEERVGPVDGIIAGHCGVAFQRSVAGLHWVNAGAIGMPPHDGRPETRFAVLGESGVVFHRLAYDRGAAAAAMRAAGLTQGYERALITGLWPSDDILPPEMKDQSFAIG